MEKKVFIITGANRGLGKAFVDVLIKNEANFVISVSRSMSEEQQKYSSKRFFFLKADLSSNGIRDNITVIKNMIDGEAIWFINNASIIEPIIKIEDLSEAAIDQTISVNIKSTIVIVNFLLKNFSNNLLSFVNISSGAANRAINSWSLYCSSKAFIKMFFEVAECEYQQHKFFNIDPGVMDTQMQKSIRSTDFPDVSSFRNLEEEGKLKLPIDVAIEILNKVS